MTVRLQVLAPRTLAKEQSHFLADNVGAWLPISPVVSLEEYLQNHAKFEPLFSLLEEHSNPNAPYRSVFSEEKFFGGALGVEGFFLQLPATLVRWIRRLSPAV
jgi:hypothetical protein